LFEDLPESSMPLDLYLDAMTKVTKTPDKQAERITATFTRHKVGLLSMLSIHFSIL
jgi:hypothetical protein